MCGIHLGTITYERKIFPRRIIEKAKFYCSQHFSLLHFTQSFIFKPLSHLNKKIFIILILKM